MLYNIEEIMAYTSAFLVYKRSDEIFNKKYNLTCNSSKSNADSIFLSYQLTINRKPVNTFINGRAETAIKKNGTRGLFLDKKIYLAEETKPIIKDYIDNGYIDFIILTTLDSTVDAAAELCKHTVQKVSDKTKFVAVTGSIGKTSTTEMVAAVLSQSHSVYKSSVSNLRIQILDAINNIDEESDYMVIECSGAVKGHLEKHSKMFSPSGIIITRATSEGIGKYGSIDNISKEKSKLMTFMDENSVAVLNDTESFRRYASGYRPRKYFVKDGSYELIETGHQGSKFIFEGNEYQIPVVGLHQIDNAIKVITLARELRIKVADIQNGLKTFKQAYDRWVVDKYKNNVTLITDIPNNPSYETLIANIKTFLDLYKDAPYKRLCISSIQELGNFELDYYLKLSKYLITLPVDEISVMDTERDNKVKFIYDYIKSHSNIKTIFFERPKALNLDDEFVKYLKNSLNFPQATLLKIQDDNNDLHTGRIKDILRDALPDIYLSRN